MRAEIEALERAGWDALTGPEGAAFYERWMADDGLMVFPGAVMDKAAAVNAIAAAEPWTSYQLNDVRVIEIGPEGAVVVYRAEALRRDVIYVAEMASHYARRDGRWQLILHQQSPASN